MHIEHFSSKRNRVASDASLKTDLRHEKGLGHVSKKEIHQLHNPITQIHTHLRNCTESSCTIEPLFADNSGNIQVTLFIGNTSCSDHKNTQWVYRLAFMSRNLPCEGWLQRLQSFPLWSTSSRACSPKLVQRKMSTNKAHRASFGGAQGTSSDNRS